MTRSKFEQAGFKAWVLDRISSDTTTAPKNPEEVVFNGRLRELLEHMYALAPYGPAPMLPVLEEATDALRRQRLQQYQRTETERRCAMVKAVADYRSGRITLDELEARLPSDAIDNQPLKTKEAVAAAMAGREGRTRRRLETISRIDARLRRVRSDITAAALLSRELGCLGDKGLPLDIIRSRFLSARRRAR